MPTKLSYRRLRKEQGGFDDNEDTEKATKWRRVNIVRPSSRSWCRFRSLRRRFIGIKIPRLRRFRFLTKKVRVVSLSCAKVLRRLKESQAHFGDLFAGNYLFVQVNPSSLKKCIQNYELSLGSLPASAASPL